MSYHIIEIALRIISYTRTPQKPFSVGCLFWFEWMCSFTFPFPRTTDTFRQCDTKLQRFRVEQRCESDTDCLLWGYRSTNILVGRITRSSVFRDIMYESQMVVPHPRSNPIDASQCNKARRRVEDTRREPYTARRERRSDGFLLLFGLIVFAWLRLMAVTATVCRLGSKILVPRTTYECFSPTSWMT